jgi:NTE family protein
MSDNETLLPNIEAQYEHGTEENHTPSSAYRKIPPVGLALGGGVARGFAHIGVLEVLAENNIKPRIISGTSIGALAGACFSLGKLDEFKEWALSLNRLKIFSYLDFRVRSAGLIGGKKLDALLKKHFSDQTIRAMPQQFAAIATDLVTGHEVWLRDGELVSALKASFALPGVFAPVEYRNRFLADGALVNPVPVSACQALGAVMTIAVDLNADIMGKARKPGNAYATIAGFDAMEHGAIGEEQEKELRGSSLARRLFRRKENTPSLFGVMVSSLAIVQDRLTRSRLAGDPPDVHIKPKIGHIGLMEFERAEDLIQLGREAAQRALPDIMDAYQVFFSHTDYAPDIPSHPEENTQFEGGDAP